ncbi:MULTISPECIES: undecaprenyl-phosphate glucose phosphotransferase [unclassified Ochrobactrum]|uniref:undecaprenyl-phosphate glucose phosphotransferase n=1 Tax=unclassified Ochrobactrum TaxID=239106 RepID=UPI0015FE5A94|nr:Undecaprenyl-phosphate glucose phosphotransferase [Ochrobactrum sp. RH2CCR150]MDH7785142.1 Undecaprenyl-phosphate glucose phosphotransferase [Ochrobactrum sp. 19YEA23]URQ76153.1 MAG: undecaprenyl-phosphate glucose phosphotransferase [Candidatus Ochrobactrum gambitense]WEK17236.1 MAG: undecaprenyl-phosphate glucose phosphotransferase [Candidatus Ochrobactrum gambitense]
MRDNDAFSPFGRKAIEASAKQDSKPQEPVELSPLAQSIAAQYRRDTFSPLMLSGVVRLVEFGLIFLMGILSLGYYVGLQSNYLLYYPLIIIAGGVLYVALMEINDGYQVNILRSPTHHLRRLIISWAATLGTLAVLGFLFKVSAHFSRGWFLIWAVSAIAVILISRLIIAWKIRRWARNGTMERRAVIVGGGPNAEALIRSLEQQPDNDIRICGIFDDRDDKRSPPVVAGYPKLGNINELIEFARIAHIDLLIVSLPISAEARVLALLKKLWVLPVDIRLSALNNHLRFRPRSYSYVGSVPMLDIFDKPINDWDSVAKRIFDIAFSIVGIIVLSPIMIGTAIAIKLDSKGPVFFKQKRHGFNNEVINVWKFRSMYTEQCDPTARNAVTKNDPRVTRVGRFIRKTSIDELPQFFNVIAGSLSLVGPRPHAVAAHSNNLLYNEVVDGYFARHRVKPGVTGWAQINGWRGEIDNEEKITMRTEYDLYYIENWSLWFDLKILFLTPIRLLNTENAY